jgi:hypothetical protein
LPIVISPRSLRSTSTSSFCRSLKPNSGYLRLRLTPQMDIALVLIKLSPLLCNQVVRLAFKIFRER